MRDNVREVDLRIERALLTVLLATGASAAFTKPASTAPAASSADSYSESSRADEAAKARELEQKAEEYKDRFAEIQSSDMSAEEKAQAASELIDEQQRAIQEAQDSHDGGEPGGDGY